MNILITGSSGQIGTNVGLALLDRGDSVLGVDIRPNNWTDRIETVSTDLSRSGSADLPSGGSFDMVLHFAAHAKVYELVEHPERAMENIAMSFAMIEYCRRNKLPLAEYKRLDRLFWTDVASGTLKLRDPGWPEYRKALHLLA